MVDFCLFSNKQISEMHEDQVASCDFMPESCCCDGCSFFCWVDAPKELTGDD